MEVRAGRGGGFAAGLFFGGRGGGVRRDGGAVRGGVRLRRGEWGRAFRCWAGAASAYRLVMHLTHEQARRLAAVLLVDDEGAGWGAVGSGVAPLLNRTISQARSTRRLRT